MTYRPEIDGLRAIAVLSVILYHADFKLFSGGFVGVDVFFVISGFLITSILINDLSAGTFRIARFYERRARRILPALFLVIGVSIVPALLLFLPQEFNNYARSIVAVVFFISNIVFWRETGYFDTSAVEKPLLHTWSLAVEEQYYIMFPLLLLIVWRLDRRWLTAILLAIALASLALSSWASTHYPSANFYLLPTRAWELLVGSVSAVVASRHVLPRSDLAGALGLVLIGVAVLTFNSTMPLPGVLSLVPVCGTALLLLFVEKDSVVGRFLSFRVFVWIGLVSYSAYLWHQPVFAFFRVHSFEPLSFGLRLALVFVSLGLAYLSWRFVETPFRAERSVSQRGLFVSLGSCAIFLTSFGVGGMVTNGYERLRFSDDARAVLATVASSPLRAECHFPQWESVLNRAPCLVVDGTEPSVAVLGNSHATELAFALGVELAPRQIGVVQYSISDCAHNLGVQGDAGSICQRWLQAAMQGIIDDTRLSQVVISYRNDYFMNEPSYLAALDTMITLLMDAGKHVTLVLQAPVLNRPIGAYLRGANLGEGVSIVGSERQHWRAAYEPVLSHIAALQTSLYDHARGSLTILDPADHFCSETLCFAVAQGAALYFDDNHMSVAGAGIVARAIAATIGG